jgi:CheY-like chemotaxis protein
MSRTILLADDSVTIQKVVELTFLDEGYAVVAVGNGSDAAARLDEVRPDLVIADVHMPGLNGYDLCKRAKGWRAQTPVLLLVGTFEPFDKGQFAESGADAVLKKPFDSQELLRQAQDLLRSAPAETAEPEAEVASGWSLADMATEDLPSASATVALPSAFSAVSPFPAPVPAPPAAPPAASPAPTPTASGPLSDADVERIAHRVAELISERVVREVSWEVVPDLAEVIIKDRIRELESQVD